MTEEEKDDFRTAELCEIKRKAMIENELKRTGYYPFDEEENKNEND